MLPVCSLRVRCLACARSYLSCGFAPPWVGSVVCGTDVGFGGDQVLIDIGIPRGKLGDIRELGLESVADFPFLDDASIDSL
eukprot:2459513-Rhodomonas_salina.1